MTRWIADSTLTAPLIAVLLIAFWIAIASPFVSSQMDAETAIYVSYARAMIRLGIVSEGMVDLVGDNQPIVVGRPVTKYLEHSPLNAAVVALFFKLFGISVVSARLAAILFSAITYFIAFLFVLRRLQRNSGLLGNMRGRTRILLFFTWCVWVAVTVPWTWFRAAVPNFEPLTMGFMTLGSYLIFGAKSRRVWFAGFFALLLSALADWPGYFALLYIFLFQRHSIRRKAFIASLTISIFLLTIYWSGYRSLSSVNDFFMVNIRDLGNDTLFLLSGTFATRMLQYARFYDFGHPLLITSTVTACFFLPRLLGSIRAGNDNLLALLDRQGFIILPIWVTLLNVLAFSTHAYHHSFWIVYSLPALLVFGFFSLCFIYDILMINQVTKPLVFVALAVLFAVSIRDWSSYRNQLASHRMLGSADQRTVTRLLEIEDINKEFILSDGTSVSVLEAFSCELPVVVSGVVAYPEWVEDGVNGYIVPRRDSVILAERLVHLLGDAELGHEMGRRDLKIAQERADWENNFNRLEDIYKQLISQRRRW